MSPFIITLLKQFILGSSVMLAIMILSNCLICKKQSSNNAEGIDHD